MSFYFIIQSGPLEGTRYKASSELSLGRGPSANISVQDPNMSSLHAQVQQKEGQLYLIDKGSKNKIRVNNKKTESVLLTDGLQFQLGNTKIQVEEVETNAQVPPEEKSWNQLLYDQLFIQKTFVNAPPAENMSALTPMVELTFITGLQRKTKWLLGYGPRHIGPSSYDLPIIGNSIPDICFSIVPENNVLVFKTKHADKVLFNKKSVNTATIKAGDTVCIDNITIQVQLL